MIGDRSAHVDEEWRRTVGWESEGETWRLHVRSKNKEQDRGNADFRVTLFLYIELFFVNAWVLGLGVRLRSNDDEEEEEKVEIFLVFWWRLGVKGEVFLFCFIKLESCFCVLWFKWNFVLEFWFVVNGWIDGDCGKWNKVWIWWSCRNYGLFLFGNSGLDVVMIPCWDLGILKLVMKSMFFFFFFSERRDFRILWKNFMNLIMLERIFFMVKEQGEEMSVLVFWCSLKLWVWNLDGFLIDRLVKIQGMIDWIHCENNLVVCELVALLQENI